MELPSTMWTVLNNQTSTIFSNNQSPSIYPIQIKQDFLKQLNKVYTTCIHSTQYLPQLFTLDNAYQILSSGLYIAHKQLQFHEYSFINSVATAQHCKINYLQVNITLFILKFTNLTFRYYFCKFNFTSNSTKNKAN